MPSGELCVTGELRVDCDRLRLDANSEQRHGAVGREPPGHVEAARELVHVEASSNPRASRSVASEIANAAWTSRASDHAVTSLGRIQTPELGTVERVTAPAQCVAGNRAGVEPACVLREDELDLADIDLAGVVITADALHTQREHVAELHARGAHWVLTVKGNQPRLRRQLAELPWRQVGEGHRSAETGHGRREIRVLKVVTIAAVTIAAGIEFPHARQAIQVTRRTRPVSARTGKKGRWRTETVYAINDLAPHDARPDELAACLGAGDAFGALLRGMLDVASRDLEACLLCTAGREIVRCAASPVAVRRRCCG
jgi:hypothetical protein